MSIKSLSKVIDLKKLSLLKGTILMNLSLLKGIFIIFAKKYIMTDLRLIEFMREELRHTPLDFKRYMYDRIIWSDRMVGLVGPRGVGKSTMVKQRILESGNPDEWLYVTADHTYFANHTLTGLADDFVKDGGSHLVIDEIHKYMGWSKELKQIYDSHAALQVIFTGSSILDIHRGSADLSRRALMFHMQGLSFREYLLMFHGIALPRLDLYGILGHKIELPADFHPLPLFRKYLIDGYLPFGNSPGYSIRMQQIISQTLEVDIPQFAGMTPATSRKLKRMLGIIAGNAPYKPNMSNLAVELGMSKNDVPDNLVYLEKAGLLGLLRDDTGGMRGLGKVEKVYLDNPNLMYALTGDNTDIGNVRETFFYNQTRVMNDVVASRISDFTIDGITFEIGGHGKGKKQLDGAEKGIVVRDEIEFGYKEFVPLWTFGLNY